MFCLYSPSRCVSWVCVLQLLVLLSSMRHIQGQDCKSPNKREFSFLDSRGNPRERTCQYARRHQWTCRKQDLKSGSRVWDICPQQCIQFSGCGPVKCTDKSKRKFSIERGSKTHTDRCGSLVENQDWCGMPDLKRNGQPVWRACPTQCSLQSKCPSNNISPTLTERPTLVFTPFPTPSPTPSPTRAPTRAPTPAPTQVPKAPPKLTYETQSLNVPCNSQDLPVDLKTGGLDVSEVIVVSKEVGDVRVVGNELLYTSRSLPPEVDSFSYSVTSEAGDIHSVTVTVYVGSLATFRKGNDVMYFVPSGTQALGRTLWESTNVDRIMFYCPGFDQWMTNVKSWTGRVMANRNPCRGIEYSVPYAKTGEFYEYQWSSNIEITLSCM